MNGLQAMVNTVTHHLLASGHDIRYNGYLNASRNYFIQTNKESYLLKWNMSEFVSAGMMIPELGKNGGPGMTLALHVYEQMREQKPHILFATNNNDRIFMIDYDEFGRLSEPYTQFGGEIVRVVLTKSLTEWYSP
jgi:hypothetical protein